MVWSFIDQLLDQIRVVSTGAMYGCFQQFRGIGYLAPGILGQSSTRQGRNPGENLGSTSAMVGRICLPWLG